MMVLGHGGDRALALVRLEQRQSQRCGHASTLTCDGDAPATLTCDGDGRWFVTATGVVRLDRRPVLRRIFQVLLERCRARPGGAMSREELIASAWPGQRFTAGSGANRLYFNIAMLRQLGLREVLLRREAGYYLDDDVLLDVRVAAPEFVRVA